MKLKNNSLTKKVITMKKLVFYIFPLLLLLACSEQKNESSTKNNSTLKSAPKMETFAVVWKWKTTEKKRILEHINEQHNQTKKLWEDGIIENAYFDKDGTSTDGNVFPSISFFIKSKSIEEAQNTLNQMAVVKYNIASYTLFPVGIKWLGRNSEALNLSKDESNKVFVVVWEKIVENSPNDSDIQIQADETLELWNKGVIENVYFDVEGVNTAKSDKTELVYFINSNNENEAINILDNLQFVKQKIAKYKLLDVGLFWMGVKK